MFDKKTKTISCINVALSIIALILECMPKSVIRAIMTGPDRYITSYHSYFGPPSYWSSTLTFAFIIAILTIISLIINIIVLIKNNKAICITSIVISSLLWFLSTYMVFFSHVTIFNILIMALFLIQSTTKLIVILNKDDQSADKRIKPLNLTSIFVLAIALFLEFIPRSVAILFKFNYNRVVGFSGSSFSYFFHASSNRLFDIAHIVALLTFCAFVLSFISLAKNKRWLCITSLAISSVCTLSSIVILIMSGRSATPYNVIIMILFLGLTVMQSIKLQISHKDSGEPRNATQAFLAIASVLMLIGSAVAQYFVEGAYVIILSTLFLVAFVIYVSKIKNDNMIANKKIAVINWIVIIITAISLLIETLPKGIKFYTIIYEFDIIEQMKIDYTSYFEGTGEWSYIFILPIVISTILSLILNIVAMFVDKKSICITSLVCGALAAVCNLVIMIWYGKYITGWMISIMILFIIQVVALSVKLKIGDWSSRKVTTSKEEYAVTLNDNEI